MKERKLLIPVRCTTRKFYLHRPPAGRNDWHVRFAPPAVDGSHRVVFRSTGTKEIGAAKRIAAQIIESFWNNAGRGAEPLKLRNDNATVGALIERYRANATQRRDRIQGNIQSLRLMVRTVLWRRPMDLRAWKKSTSPAPPPNNSSSHRRRAAIAC
jgi:hypothetical protein